MEAIDCIFCGTSGGNVVIRENGYTARQCPDCGLIYVSPRPDAAEVANLYAHGAAHLPPEHHLRLTHMKRLYARHHLGRIARFGSPGTLLEIGAGAGSFLAEAQAAGWTAHGIELNGFQARYIRETLGLPCEEVPLGDGAFSGVAFDLVYHCDVLSHFRDPLGEFTTIRERLKPGGLHVFETGNLPDVAPAHFYRYLPFQCPDHLFFFGRQGLLTLLDRTGFEPRAVFAYSIEPQLMVMQGIRAVLQAAPALQKRLGRAHQAASEPPPASEPIARPAAPPANRGDRPGPARWLFDWLMYGLRYHVGAVAPGHGRFQSLLVVARKRDGSGALEGRPCQ